MPLSPAIQALIDKQHEQFSGLANDIIDGLHKLSGSPSSIKGFMPGEPTAEMIGEVGAPCTESELAEMYANGEISDEIIQEEARGMGIRLA